MNRQTVIVSGGSVEEAFVLAELQKMPQAFVIGADSGVRFLYRNHIRPNYIVGDFDSLEPEIVEYYKRQTGIPIREFNPVKDASDTEIAIRLAIELGCSSITLFGGTGSRLDHVMANIQSLKIAQDAGIPMRILDPHNQITLIAGEEHLRKDEAFGTYFSLFPLGGSVRDLSISGAKYSLDHHLLEPYDSLCVSNEIAGEEAVITFPEGLVILMQTRD